MKGCQKVIDALNQLLVDELAARDQYFIHSSMLFEWELDSMATRIAHEMEEETDHARQLIKRILFLEGTPEMTPSKINVGKDVPDIIDKDLKLELTVVKNLRKTIALCEHELDFVSRDILLGLLKDTEEDHTHWLERQQRLINMVGLQNYIQSQMKEGGLE